MMNQWYGGGYGGWGSGMMGGCGGWGYGGWEHPWVLWLLALAAPFVLVILLWSFVWKGLALWHAARRGQYWWFLILLVVNTLGILEIIYLFFVVKLKWGELFSAHEHHHAH
jgi:hypothetical protein